MTEATKQRRKREKAAAKDAALGVEKLTLEVAGVFKPDLKRVMAAHDINSQKEVYQLLLLNLNAADFDAQARMPRRVTTPLVISEKMSLAFHDQSITFSLKTRVIDAIN